MLVSILTPSFNQARYLPDCLTSVANQTYEDIEHIVCDGGSSDGSVEVLRRAEGVRWVSEPDRGQSHALNKALAMSSGEIVGWVNSDDAYADRRAVAAAVETFEAYPDVGVVYGHSIIINEENLVLHFWWTPDNPEWLLPRMTPFAQPSVFLRRSMLPEPFVREELNFVMDRDLWLRLRASGVEFRRMNTVVGVERHQAARKVLSEPFLRERSIYWESGLGRPAPDVLLRPLKIALRFRGAIDAFSLHRSICPAFPLRFDGSVRLAVRQCFVPRHRMPGVRKISR